MSDVSDGMKKKIQDGMFPKPYPKYTQDRQMLRGKLKCPHCGHEIKVRCHLD